MRSGIEPSDEVADGRGRSKATKAWRGMVKQTPGAIGYVELIYAAKNKMEYGSVKNVAGVFLKATSRR